MALGLLASLASLSPDPSPASAGNAAVVAAGGGHTCALTAAGGLKCWGLNWAGQLGDGTFTDRTTPGYVTGLTSNVVTVAAVEGHTCALTTAGGLQCWARNNSGQLGDGTRTNRTRPVDVTGFSMRR